MGTFAEVRCENNTVLSGEGFLSCTESGTWDFSMPACIIITTTQAPTTRATTTSTVKTTQATIKKPSTMTHATTPMTRITTAARSSTKRTTTTVRTTTKKPVRASTKIPPKTSTAQPKPPTTPKQVTTTPPATTESPFLLRETGTDPDETFWRNWRNLLYLGCESVTSDRSPFCDQVTNQIEYSNLTSFELPESSEYQHMDTKLLRHLTDARKALQSPAIRSSLDIEHILQLILYGERYSDPSSKISKTMENSIRIVICLYVDTILLDKNFKPDVTMSSSEDITQKLKSSLWQVASFAHKNLQTQQATEFNRATTVASSNANPTRSHRATGNAVKNIEFANMETHTIRRVVETTAPSKVVTQMGIIAVNEDLPVIETTTVTPAAKPNTCELRTLARQPENSALVKIVSGDGTTIKDLANITKVSIGSALTFNCRDGYEMIGAAKATTAKCKEDLNWSSLSFECKGIVKFTGGGTLKLELIFLNRFVANSGHL